MPRLFMLVIYALIFTSGDYANSNTTVLELYWGDYLLSVNVSLYLPCYNTDSDIVNKTFPYELLVS